MDAVLACAGIEVAVHVDVATAFRLRSFQATNSVCTLCQARLTVSLLTAAPPNNVSKAQRSRRAFMPARYVPAINAAAASVIRR